MNLATKVKLKTAYDICLNAGKSLEYTIEFMQSFAKVEHACVMNWLKVQERG